MMVEDTAHSLQPTGLALAIFVVSLILLVLSASAVGLRAYFKYIDHIFGVDDALIVAGLIIYTVDVALACHGARVGLGTLDKDLNMWILVEGKKFLMLWMMVYIVGLATIKSSICVTLYRIASTNNAYRISVFVLLALTITTMLVTLIGVLLLCRPISANWTGAGSCASMSSMVALSYTSTGSTILTDLALAILPGLMVWNTLKTKRKIFIFILLSFGSIASITTMIRAPYIQHYWTPLDNLNYWTGYIVLLSNIETAIGLITSSVPALRKLKSILLGTDTSTDAKLASKPKSLVTFGSLPVRNQSAMRFRNPTDQGVSFTSVHARDWTRLGDGDSDGSAARLRQEQEEDIDGIRAEYSYQVELTKIPTK